MYTLFIHNSWPSGAWGLGFRSHVRSRGTHEIGCRVNQRMCFYTLRFSLGESWECELPWPNPAPCHRDTLSLENTYNIDLTLIGEGGWVALQRHAFATLLRMRITNPFHLMRPNTRVSTRAAAFKGELTTLNPTC